LRLNITVGKETERSKVLQTELQQGRRKGINREEQRRRRELVAQIGHSSKE
jgi:hypothetical protein